MNRVNYDKVADIYNYRYRKSYRADGLAKKLVDICLSIKANSVLEVGCGTGHWLAGLPTAPFSIGADASFGMLAKAKTANPGINLIQADANRLPLKPDSFDLIYCINAIHHFVRPESFIRDCFALLSPGGTLIIVGMDPHTGLDDWFVYDYFEGTRQADLLRYPSPAKLESWLRKAGFQFISFETGERLRNNIRSDEIFPLPKDYTSQLSLLSDQEFLKGVNRIKNEIANARSANREAEFKVDISLSMVRARVR